MEFGVCGGSHIFSSAFPKRSRGQAGVLRVFFALVVCCTLLDLYDDKDALCYRHRSQVSLSPACLVVVVLIVAYQY